MQIRTLSESVKIKLEELKKLQAPYRAFFFPYKLPEIVISPISKDDNLAYYDIDTDCIVFQEDFIMSADPHSEKNVFLHEMAHALQFKNGEDTVFHGETFRKYCAMLGCDPEFSRAAVKAEKSRTESYARKVEKLLALTSSPYEEESKAALLKAEELMASHGLEYAFKHRDENKLYYAMIAESGRTMASLKMLYNLVEDMTGVFLLYEESDKPRFKKICVYGSLEQVETAIYLSGYLSSELDRSAKAEKKRRGGERFSAESYKAGLISGLARRIRKENADAERALTLTTEKNRDMFIDITKERLEFRNNHSIPNSIADYGQGIEASKNIDLPRKHGSGITRKLIE